jgi:hypothetical protein
MKIFAIIVIYVGILSHSLYGQHNISGMVKNSKNEPIPLATVLVLNQTDSTLIKGLICNVEGRFSGEISDKNCILKISAVGFNDRIIQCDTTGQQLEIVLEDYVLNQLDVVAKTPLYSFNDGNMTINVDNTLLSYSTSIAEIISKSPGLALSGTEVEVVGKGKSIIFIDNQKATYETLKSIPVSQIRSIEIVKNPDSQYDAGDMAVILVTLKTQTLNGFQGNALLQFTQGFYQLGFADFSINFHKNKFTLSTALNNNIGATGTRSESNFNTVSSVIDYEATNVYKEKVYLRNVPNWLIGANYNFNEKNSISAQYNGSYAFYDLDVQNKIDLTFENDSLVKINSIDTALTEDYSHSGSVNYKLALDTLGSKLFFGATYNIISTRYDDKIFESNQSEMEEYTVNSVSNGISQSKVYGLQADWTQMIKTKGTFKLGVKSAQSAANSSVFVLNSIQLDTVGILDNSLFYGENLFSGYTSYHHKLEKGSVQIGVRLENTKAQAKQNDLVYIDTNYLSIFPNVKWQYKSKKIQIIESFTSRIQRPRFADVTPYVYYINSFSSVKGNPNLLPSKVYSYEHKMIFENLDVSIGASLFKNPRAFLALPNQNNGAVTFQSQNLKSMVTSYIESTYSVGKGIWNSSLTANVSLTKFEDDVYDISQIKTTPSLYLFLYNQLNFKKFATVEISARFTNRSQNGRVENLPAGTLDISLSKALFNDKWNVQMGIYDIFRTDRRIQSSILNNDSYYTNVLQDTRYLRVTISRSFGKLENNDFEHFNIGEGEINRAR